MVVFELKAKTNKRPTGHCTHLRKSFKHDKLQESYVDTPTLIKKKKIISLFGKERFFFCENLNLLYSKMLRVEIDYNWPSGFEEKDL